MKKTVSKGVLFDTTDLLCILHSDVYYIVNSTGISTPFFYKNCTKEDEPGRSVKKYTF